MRFLELPWHVLWYVHTQFVDHIHGTLGVEYIDSVFVLLRVLDVHLDLNSDLTNLICNTNSMRVV